MRKYLIRFFAALPSALLAVSLFLVFPWEKARANSPEVVHFCYLNWGKQGGEHLPDKGFVPDLISQVLREAGYEPKVTILPWVRCVEQSKQKKFDFVGSYWKGGDGDRFFDYFHPTTVDRINFIVLKGKGLTSGRPEDLYGKRIGYLRGAGGLKKFRDQADKFKVVEAKNDHVLIKMLQNGRIDAVLSNSPHISSLAETSFPDLVGKLKVLQPPLQVNIAAPAIAWDHPKREKMKARYNAAYEKLFAEGIYQYLMDKHKIKVDYE